MKIRVLLSLLLFFAALNTHAQTAKTFHVKSPDGKIDLMVSAGKTIKWSVNHEDTQVILPSSVSLQLGDGMVLGTDASVKNAKPVSVNNVINTPLYKKYKVTDNYNQLTLTFKGDYGLIFRAYNDAVAYRFFTSKSYDITIENEEANFNFKDDDKAFLPFVNDYRHHDKFNTSFESTYDELNISAVKKDTLAFMPVLVDLGNGKKAALLE
ncbi:MAG: glycoside hydrolase family 97 N-terminal domain-containing protein, partial [Mucilaginibacter sp.]